MASPPFQAHANYETWSIDFLPGNKFHDEENKNIANITLDVLDIILNKV